MAEANKKRSVSFEEKEQKLVNVPRFEEIKSSSDLEIFLKARNTQIETREKPALIEYAKQIDDLFANKSAFDKLAKNALPEEISEKDTKTLFNGLVMSHKRNNLPGDNHYSMDSIALNHMDDHGNVVMSLDEQRAAIAELFANDKDEIIKNIEDIKSDYMTGLYASYDALFNSIKYSKMNCQELIKEKKIKPSEQFENLEKIYKGLKNEQEKMPSYRSHKVLSAVESLARDKNLPKDQKEHWKQASDLIFGTGIYKFHKGDWHANIIQDSITEENHKLNRTEKFGIDAILMTQASPGKDGIKEQLKKQLSTIVDTYDKNKVEQKERINLEDIKDYHQEMVKNFKSQGEDLKISEETIEKASSIICNRYKSRLDQLTADSANIFIKTAVQRSLDWIKDNPDQLKDGHISKETLILGVEKGTTKNKQALRLKHNDRSGILDRIMGRRWTTQSSVFTADKPNKYGKLPSINDAHNKLYEEKADQEPKLVSASIGGAALGAAADIAVEATTISELASQALINVSTLPTSIAIGATAGMFLCAGFNMIKKSTSKKEATMDDKGAIGKHTARILAERESKQEGINLRNL